MSSSVADASAATSCRRRAGFTLVELLVAINIIALLVGILFPGFSRAKALAVCASHTSHVKSVLLGIRVYALDNNGKLPLSLKDLLDGDYIGFPLTQSPPDSESYQWEDDDEIIYRYFPVKNATGEPVRLDSLLPDTVLICVTGACDLGPETEIHGFADGHTEQVEPDGTCAGEAAPAPEPVDKLQAKLDRVNVLGMEAIAKILALPDSADVSLKTLKSDVAAPEDVVAAVAFLDQDDDGFVTASDLLSIDQLPMPSPDDSPTSFSILREFIHESLVELELDDEYFDQLPEMPAGELAIMGTEQAGDAFSFENLCLLTVEYVDEPDVSFALCAKLVAAMGTESRGKQKARNNILRAYRNHIDAQTDVSILPENAATLKLFSLTLETAAD